MISHFENIVKQLYMLHIITYEFGNDCEEADNVRDHMENDWLYLSEDEKKIINDISHGLWLVHDFWKTQ